MNSPFRERMRYHVRAALQEAKHAPILGSFENLKKRVLVHGNGYYTVNAVEDMLKEEMSKAAITK